MDRKQYSYIFKPYLDAANQSIKDSFSNNLTIQNYEAFAAFATGAALLPGDTINAILCHKNEPNTQKYLEHLELYPTDRKDFCDWGEHLMYFLQLPADLKSFGDIHNPFFDSTAEQFYFLRGISLTNPAEKLGAAYVILSALFLGDRDTHLLARICVDYASSCVQISAEVNKNIGTFEEGKDKGLRIVRDLVEALEKGLAEFLGNENKINDTLSDLNNNF